MIICLWLIDEKKRERGIPFLEATMNSFFPGGLTESLTISTKNQNKIKKI